MKPVVTTEQMRAIDSESQVPEADLITRAGAAVAVRARRMLGGTYGRRVTVIAGKGNNGADGRVAAECLRRCGVKVDVVRPDNKQLPDCDLIIDAAFGTGFRGEYQPAYGPHVPVLAVDIPSGILGDTGGASDDRIRAHATITLAALKPGLLLHPGRQRAGSVEVVDIGLDVSGTRQHLVETTDVFERLPAPAVGHAHKWQTAVGIVAGSSGMTGAAELCTRAAGRAGAGMVRLMVPGAQDWQLPSSEAVAKGLPEANWVSDALSDAGRLHALVVGPGLGRAPETVASVRQLVEQAEVPLIVDGDALYALSEEGGFEILRKRSAPTILTPHDGEFRYLTGDKPVSARWKSAADLARQTASVVLLKGDTTVVADGDRILYCTTGSPRLATAGTGDVLSGVIGAFAAQEMEPMWAAASAAHVHGAAAQQGYRRGLMAGDLPELIADWLSDVGEGGVGS